MPIPPSGRFHPSDVHQASSHGSFDMSQDRNNPSVPDRPADLTCFKLAALGYLSHPLLGDLDSER